MPKPHRSHIVSVEAMLNPGFLRSQQNTIAQRLYAADPARQTGDCSDSTCWIAACLVAYAIVNGEYGSLSRQSILDYYGDAAVNG